MIAYEQPQQSPLAHLLALSQREVVADAVNAAILQASSSGPGDGAAARGSSSSKPQVRLLCRHLHARCIAECCCWLVYAHAASSELSCCCLLQSALETLLQQLVASRKALRDESGGMGEVFRLQDHLNPPTNC